MKKSLASIHASIPLATRGIARRSRNQRGPSGIKQEGREDRGEVHSIRFPNSPIFLFKILLEMSDSRMQQCKDCFPTLDPPDLIRRTEGQTKDNPSSTCPIFPNLA
jgi:hypothetical protein